MPILIRHVKSQANGSAAIARGNPDAKLSEEGLGQIPYLRDIISATIGERAIDSISVNVSKLKRTEQTAKAVGFTSVMPLAILNESLEAAPLRVLAERMRGGWLPQDTLEHAEEFLGNPELHAEFNFSHGLFIASCRYVAGERPEDGNTINLVPFYGEMLDIAS